MKASTANAISFQNMKSMNSIETSEMKRRILNLLIAFDQLFWVLFTLGNGSPDETISAGLWRMESQGKIMGKVLRPLIDRLFWFDPEHCKSAYNAEFRKLHLPGNYRG